MQNTSDITESSSVDDKIQKSDAELPISYHKHDSLIRAAERPAIRMAKRPKTHEELCRMEKPKYQKLRRHMRYMYLLYFQRYDWEPIIGNVYGDEVASDPDSELFQWAYWQIGEIIKGWKNICISKMIVSSIVSKKHLHS